jgi:hypothetical protein
MLADVLEAKWLLARELLPQVALPLLERHVVRPVKPGNARLRVRLSTVFLFARRLISALSDPFRWIQDMHSFQVRYFVSTATRFRVGTDRSGDSGPSHRIRSAMGRLVPKWRFMPRGTTGGGVAHTTAKYG